MIYQALSFKPEHVYFVERVFSQNMDVLHGGSISTDEWRQCLCIEPDAYEINFIITADGKNAAWLKLNGLNKPKICISMLVVDKEYQRKGVGGFAILFAEGYARKLHKAAIVIQTTKDNLAATACYLKQGYVIEKEIRYAVGDGILRDGYRFRKVLV